MKIATKYFRIIALIVLFIVFILQGIWLYNTFQISEKNLKKELEKEFIYATQKETAFREQERRKASRERLVPKKDFIFKPNKDITTYPVNIMILEALHFYNCPFSIDRISTILKDKIKEQNLSSNFVINRIRTKDNVVLESTAPKTEKEWDSALKTEPIPLRVDESEVLQLYLLNPNWTIFYQMLSIIILSLVVVILVAVALWWLLHLYENEKKLRQFQKDHTEALMHNMATPLQTVGVINQTLKNTPNIDERKKEEFFNIEERQIKKLQGQVSKVLTVSRAHSSGLSIHKKETDIKKLIEGVCETSKENKRKDITIQTDLNLQKPTANVDSQLFADVLSNLIENSIKYSGDSVAIQINATNNEEGLKISVRDNGFGIAPKYQKNIFDKFNRGAAPFRKGEKGFGIGLSFVKAVIEAHKGNVLLRSEGENKGTTFTITLPQ